MKILSFIEIFLLGFLKMLVFNPFPDVLSRPKLGDFSFIGIHEPNELRPKLSFNLTFQTFGIFLRPNWSLKYFGRLLIFLDKSCSYASSRLVLCTFFTCFSVIIISVGSLRDQTTNFSNRTSNEDVAREKKIDMTNIPLSTTAPIITNNNSLYLSKRNDPTVIANQASTLITAFLSHADLVPDLLRAFRFELRLLSWEDDALQMSIRYDPETWYHRVLCDITNLDTVSIAR